MRHAASTGYERDSWTGVVPSCVLLRRWRESSGAGVRWAVAGSPEFRTPLPITPRASDRGGMAKHLDDDPRTRYRKGGTQDEEQSQPGLTSETDPKPDHGEDSYVGSGRLEGRRALITGGDSGIGRAVAIAFAREGADVAIVHLPEEAEDAASTAALIEQAGRTALLLPGDVRDEDFCADAVARTVDGLGGLDILVLNAAYQKNRDGIESFVTEEFDRVFRTNLYSMFWFARAAVPQMKPGSSHHHDRVDPGGAAVAEPARLRDDQGRAGELHEGARAGARGEGHPGERGRARTDLDAAHPRHRLRRHLGLRAGHARSGAPASRPNSRPRTSCSPRWRRRTSRARSCR